MNINDYKLVFLAGGQGCQYPGMLHELYQNVPKFKQLIDYYDQIFKRIMGESLAAVLYRSPIDCYAEFSDISYTHPAIFLTQYCLATLLIDKGLYPACLLGYSLGELVTSTLAGALTVEDAATIVAFQASVVKQKCQTGGMLVILSSVAMMDDYPQLFEDCFLATINFPGHFVVSGTIEAINNLRSQLIPLSITSQILPIHYPFHSPLIADIKENYQGFMDSVRFFTPGCSIISSTYVNEVSRVDPDFFWNVASLPVRFEETIQLLERQGPCLYLDLSPNGMLANFLQYLLKNVETESVILPAMSMHGGNVGKLNELYNVRLQS
ncbi:MAG: acyltransferase domain-containing protein [Tatlockia sp.]|nr:acyltransferase domain-containing protein [Tatlockia sp.]